MNPWAYQGWPLFPSHCHLWDQGFHCLGIDISDLCVFVIALSIFSAACFVSFWWPFSSDVIWSDRSICCMVCPEPEGWASTWLEPTRWWSLIQTGTPAMTFRHRTGKRDPPSPPPPPPPSVSPTLLCLSVSNDILPFGTRRHHSSHLNENKFTCGRN